MFELGYQLEVLFWEDCGTFQRWVLEGGRGSLVLDHGIYSLALLLAPGRHL